MIKVFFKENYTVVGSKEFTSDKSMANKLDRFRKDPSLLSDEIVYVINSFSEQFIEEFQDNIDWVCLCSYQPLSEKFINKFLDKICWQAISGNQVLSEEFIEKHQDKVCWQNISMFQKLSESFIDKFQDKVHWVTIFHYQQLSEEFIENHTHKVKQFNFNNLIWKQKVSEKFVEKFIDNFSDWPTLCAKQDFSKEFLIKYYDKVCWDVLEHKLYKGFFHDAPKEVKLHITLNHRNLTKYF